MKRIRYFLLTLAVAALSLFSLSISSLAEDTEDDRIAVYVQVPDDWSEPCLWAWDDDGTNAFEAWPGGEMEADTNNEGWYYCWIPKDTTNIIVNANAGEVQTGEQKIESKNTWITVTDPESVTVSYDAQTEGEIPEYVEKFQVHAKVSDTWSDVCLWAWSAPDGTNAFEAWPGKAMKADEDGWYTASVPIWVNSIIVNGNGGDVQTEDLSIDPAEIWVTVEEDGTADFTYNDPDAVDAEDISVYVKAPSDWEAPHLWAWSAPDGTNAFASWPGEALEEREDGWLTLQVPGWINSIIVNGNEGNIQTEDISVDTGKDIWVVVTDAEHVEVSYEEPADETETQQESAETAEEPESNSSNTMAVIIIVIMILVVAVCAIIYYKKKKA